jgi:hypothetical protein
LKLSEEQKAKLLQRFPDYVQESAEREKEMQEHRQKSDQKLSDLLKDVRARDAEARPARAPRPRRAWIATRLRSIGHAAGTLVHQHFQNWLRCRAIALRGDRRSYHVFSLLSTDAKGTVRTSDPVMVIASSDSGE